MTYIVLLLLAALAVYLWSRRDRTLPRHDTREIAAPVDTPARGFGDLQGGIDRFAEIGLRLSPGISRVDLEPSFDPGNDPWWSLFFVFGIEAEEEPWDRRISPDVWTFDHEFIEGPGSYEAVVANHVGLTGRSDLFDAVEVEMEGDLDQTGAPVRITLRGNGRDSVLDGTIDNDWVDAAILSGLRAEIVRRVGDGRSFWAADNGQAEVLAFLSDDQARALNALRPDLIRPAD